MDKGNEKTFVGQPKNADGVAKNVRKAKTKFQKRCSSCSLAAEE
jgi:hypothetical protein